MKKITPWIFIVILVVLIGTTACTRSAYKAPVTEVQPTATVPFPVATQPDFMADIISGTATALAAMGTYMPTQAIMVSTPTVDLAAATKVPTNTAPPVYEIPTATPGLPDTYSLHKGESPYCLARRFNLSPIDLLSLNGLTGNEYLPVGYTLKIPGDSKWSQGDRALKSHPTQYTISADQTIYSIACEFGDVDPNDIIAANGLQDPYELKSGQQIQIP